VLRATLVPPALAVQNNIHRSTDGFTPGWKQRSTVAALAVQNNIHRSTDGFTPAFVSSNREDVE
jgi:hypothetical protein